MAKQRLGVLSKPPAEIDGAKVLYWAWSADLPFGWVGSESDSKAIAIHGLAIAQYERSSVIYRFSCNRTWEAEQDDDFASVEEAMEQLPEQYKGVAVKWRVF